ncbi:MAG: hypothetical protein H0Z24_04880 [Thermosipho sp. (in: Bacteria)]|nr:hypothetical protein [Thermosipho sp. (in: thermotogales)]
MRRRRKNSHVGLWISLIIIVLVIISGLVFWKIYSIKKSAEFDVNSVSQYLFIDPSKELGYYIFIQGDKRSVYVIKVKNHSYNSEIKQEVNFESPLLAESLMADMLGVKSVYNYYVLFNDQSLIEFSNLLGINSNDFSQILSTLSQRGLKVFDYFKLNSIIKKLRPNTTLTSPALAKLMYSFGVFSIKILDMPTMTEKPLEITVSGKKFERLYIDLEKLGQLKEEIRR